MRSRRTKDQGRLASPVGSRSRQDKSSGELDNTVRQDKSKKKDLKGKVKGIKRVIQDESVVQDLGPSNISSVDFSSEGVIAPAPALDGTDSGVRDDAAPVARPTDVAINPVMFSDSNPPPEWVQKLLNLCSDIDSRLKSVETDRNESGVRRGTAMLSLRTCPPTRSNQAFVRPGDSLGDQDCLDPGSEEGTSPSFWDLILIQRLHTQRLRIQGIKILGVIFLPLPMNRT